jgi:hypothetical protein
MRSQRPTRLKGTDKLSDALIAQRYLDLQKLREKVRKAEIRFGLRGSKKPRNRPGTCARAEGPRLPRPRLYQNGIPANQSKIRYGSMDASRSRNRCDPLNFLRWGRSRRSVNKRLVPIGPG